MRSIGVRVQVEIKPYVLDEQPCDQCGAPLAAQFCAALDCLQYLCDACWERAHAAGSRREQHQPLLKQTNEGSGSRAPGGRAAAGGGGSHSHTSGGAHRSKSGASGANASAATGGGGCNSQPQQQHRGARSGGGGHQAGRRPRGLHASQAPRLSGHSGSAPQNHGSGVARNLNLNLNLNLLGDAPAATSTACGLVCPVQNLQASNGFGNGAGDVCGKMSLFPETSHFQYY